MFECMEFLCISLHAEKNKSVANGKTRMPENRTRKCGYLAICRACSHSCLSILLISAPLASVRIFAADFLKFAFGRWLFL
jgi:hypothetical protein